MLHRTIPSPSVCTCSPCPDKVLVTWPCISCKCPLDSWETETPQLPSKEAYATVNLHASTTVYVHMYLDGRGSARRDLIYAHDGGVGLPLNAWLAHQCSDVTVMPVLFSANGARTTETAVPLLSTFVSSFTCPDEILWPWASCTCLLRLWATGKAKNLALFCHKSGLICCFAIIICEAVAWYLCPAPPRAGTGWFCGL